MEELRREGGREEGEREEGGGEGGGDKGEREGGRKEKGREEGGRGGRVSLATTFGNRSFKTQASGKAYHLATCIYMYHTRAGKVP